MNIVLDMLSGGDLRSDGQANEVLHQVLAHPQLLELLLEGLESPDDVVRGRTADVLEKISRSYPEWLMPRSSQLLQQAADDGVAMVRWHLAMVLGTLAALGHRTIEILAVLLHLLGDRSAFVRSWAIATLAIIASVHPQLKGEIIPHIAALRSDRSIAVRTRVKKALAALEGRADMPPGWVKCAALRHEV
jgi:HEAT repeat protein